MGIESMGYEQLMALRIISETPDMEGSEICKAADCSFDELHSLAHAGLIDIGSERIKQFAVHPVLTDTGHAALTALNKAGFFDV